MQTNWPASIAFTLPQEGGSRISMDSEDPGNWTGGAIGSGALIGSKWGISAQTLLASQGTATAAGMATLTQQAAEGIYKQWFWGPIQGDSLPAGLDLLVFDSAVNQGVSGASMLLQTAINGMRAQPAQPALKVDGHIGLLTLQAITDLPTRTLIAKTAILQLQSYMADRSWDLYGRGWMGRLGRRLSAAAALA